ncbi:hypothetical protein [Capnocytophaga sp. oral taxon 326]|uniref:hypothetical protein n=1 Tax=Capnocytophaga sp. oral taxon 326 TaxID=712212 RepID=UPI0002A25AA5|nr:hypothetical protein [Capnocytophaga sp. oral taxon 326]EKY10919.1 hypothetical protein HMPREF9073_03228 [Capnocytophaga sp. oral taxon 326 str. F0382]
MKKSNKYLSILFLSCTIIAPFLLWINYFAYPNRIEATAIGELISWIIYSVFLLFPFFFIYQMVLKTTKKLEKEHFELTIYTLVVWIAAVSFYAWLFYIINSHITK